MTPDLEPDCPVCEAWEWAEMAAALAVSEANETQELVISGANYYR